MYGETKEKERVAELKKYHEIKRGLFKLGYKEDLIYQACKELREWKIRRDLIPQPKETINPLRKVPGYNGNKFYNKIDKAVSKLTAVHRFILIKKYEFQWEIKDFQNHRGWKYGTAKTYIYDAKKELKILLKSLKKN